MIRPKTSRASAQQTVVHARHSRHKAKSVTGTSSGHKMASFGQASTHLPHRIQRVGRNASCGTREMLSGLWHHQQLNGQPLKNTVVLMPGPSWIAYRLMLKIVPEAKQSL